MGYDLPQQQTPTRPAAHVPHQQQILARPLIDPAVAWVVGTGLLLVLFLFSAFVVGFKILNRLANVGPQAPDTRIQRPWTQAETQSWVRENTPPASPQQPVIEDMGNIHQLPLALIPPLPEINSLAVGPGTVDGVGMEPETLEEFLILTTPESWLQAQRPEDAPPVYQEDKLEFRDTDEMFEVLAQRGRLGEVGGLLHDMRWTEVVAETETRLLEGPRFDSDILGLIGSRAHYYVVDTHLRCSRLKSHTRKFTVVPMSDWQSLEGFVCTPTPGVRDCQGLISLDTDSESFLRD